MKKTFYKNPDKIIYFVLFLLLSEYILAFFDLGADFRSSYINDSLGYINGGINFAKNGIISIYDYEYPTAFIMPLLPVIIGIFSFVFGEGTNLWISIKLLNIVLSVIAAFFIYKSVRLFTNGWIALLSVLPCFSPNIASANNYVMTEIPFRFLVILCIYYTLCAGKKWDTCVVIKYSICYVLALMLRANALPLPLFSALYIYFTVFHKKKASGGIKAICILLSFFLAFVIPWSIRNYKYFNAFIPLTYGGGSPMIASTTLWPGFDYQAGEITPYFEDTQIEFEEKYSKYLNEDGTYKNEHLSRYLDSEKEFIEWKNRLSLWLEENPKSVINYFLFSKPISLINWVYYPTGVFGFSYEVSHWFARINSYICILGFICSFLLKRNRLEMLFLGGTYVFYIFIISLSYAIDRYTFPYNGLRYVMAGIGVSLIIQSLFRIKLSKN